MNNSNQTNISAINQLSAHGGVNIAVQVQIYLYHYVLPIIVFVGLIGNITSIVVIVVDKQMRNVSSSIYLLSVLASDTGMLVSLFFVWIETLGHPLNHLPVVCQIHVYMTYVFGFLSIWYIVCITVETFITICHPTKIKQMCTLIRARVVAFVLLVAALALYILSPIITQPEPVHYPQSNRTIIQCKIQEKYEQHQKIVSYVDTVLTLIVPMVLLIILLALMTIAIIQSIQKKQQRSIKIPSSDSGAIEKGSNFTRKLPQVRVAKMLYTLSVSVVILNAPSHVFRLVFMFSQKLEQVEGFIHLILLFISYSSFAVKFFICMACSKNFRKLFINSCCGYAKVNYRSVPQQTMETTA